MNLGIGFLDKGMSYIQQGLEFVRSILNKIATILPFDPQLSVTVVFLLTSLWLGHLISKKFVVSPLSGSYILWTLIISISIFLNLMYL
mgnify:CR=1 FL=1